MLIYKYADVRKYMVLVLAHEFLRATTGLLTHVRTSYDMTNHSILEDKGKYFYFGINKPTN